MAAKSRVSVTTTKNYHYRDVQGNWSLTANWSDAKGPTDFHLSILGNQYGAGRKRLSADDMECVATLMRNYEDYKVRGLIPA